MESMQTRRREGGYQPTIVYWLAERMRARGVSLGSVPGPWRASQRRVTPPGRTSLHNIPVVTNEQAEVMVDTMEHAADVAGLLNLCGVHELNPVPALQPPDSSEAPAA
jgi:hypothetical protein